jgi:hypothetical protein
VSCSGISISALVTVSTSGTFSTSFTIISPTPGPPCGSSYLVSCPATDSAGKSPSSDAANYPCPPTPAQQQVGASCTLAFGDSGGKQATVPIAFVAAPTASSGGGGSSSSGGGSGSGSNSTTATTAAATTAASLAFTGAGPGVWALAIGGFVLIDLGFLVLTIYYRPRELFAIAGRRVNRIFGDDD